MVGRAPAGSAQARDGRLSRRRSARRCRRKSVRQATARQARPVWSVADPGEPGAAPLPAFILVERTGRGGTPGGGAARKGRTSPATRPGPAGSAGFPSGSGSSRRRRRSASRSIPPGSARTWAGRRRNAAARPGGETGRRVLAAVRRAGGFGCRVILARDGLRSVFGKAQNAAHAARPELFARRFGERARAPAAQPPVA